MPSAVRSCPLCNEPASQLCFPWEIKFEGETFGHYRCDSCTAVYVSPVPSDSVFAKMYAKPAYHDVFYSLVDVCTNNPSAEILKSFSGVKSKVLDYGCGAGHFLAAIQNMGYQATGVEFDNESAASAARNTGCQVFTFANFFSFSPPMKFDVIHLGDVLEHVPDPVALLNNLRSHMQVGSLMYIEGPLEINASPVYWAAHAFGNLKRLVRPKAIGCGKPFHLFRTSAEVQKSFFHRVLPDFNLLYWEVYETGWPYENSNLVKRFIATIAVIVGGKKIGKVVLGNRFRVIMRYS